MGRRFSLILAIETGIRLEGTILIGAVVDEEGRMAGIKHFVERGWADQVDAAIVCEPEENHLCIAQKGVMWLTITCTGITWLMGACL